MTTQESMQEVREEFLEAVEKQGLSVATVYFHTKPVRTKYLGNMFEIRNPNYRPQQSSEVNHSQQVIATVNLSEDGTESYISCQGINSLIIDITTGKRIDYMREPTRSEMSKIRRITNEIGFRLLGNNSQKGYRTRLQQKPLHSQLLF